MKKNWQYLIMAVSIGLLLGSLMTLVMHPADTAQAQSGTTCCKIDPVLWSSDGQGNITVYKIPSGPGVNLPEGTTTIYAGTSLTESLKAVGDAAYKAKQ